MLSMSLLVQEVRGSRPATNDFLASVDESSLAWFCPESALRKLLGYCFRLKPVMCRVTARCGAMNAIKLR
jgi:hypothetical protein